MDVPRDDTILADIQERMEACSTIMTDEHKCLKERGYDHHIINHGEWEYASGENNEIQPGAGLACPENTAASADI